MKNPMAKNSKLRVYQYPACSTCKNALKFLKENDIPFESLHIVETPPTMAELKAVLKFVQQKGGTLRNLFNTSGLVYKEMGLSQKLPQMSEQEALELLANNGKLIKRPFVVSPQFTAVGFKPDEWATARP